MFLAEEVDKLGNKLTVNHSKLEFSPAYSFFLRQQAELVDSNQCAPCTYWEDKTSEIIWIEIDNKIVASSCFTTKLIDHPMFPSISTHSTFVNVQYRRRGIQKILFKHFQNIARQYNCRVISQTIEINNVSRLTGAKADGLNILISVFIKNISTKKYFEDNIKIDQDPVGKPIFEYFKKEKIKLKNHLVGLGHREEIASSLTSFDEHTVGLMWVENQGNIKNIVSFNKTEIKKGSLSIYTADSYEYLDALAIHLDCSRAAIKLSIKDIEETKKIKDCGFGHVYFVLYKQVT